MSNRSLLPVEAASPLETVRRLLARVWREADLDGMLVPIWKAEEHVMQAALLQEPEQLANADPFSPVMLANGAPLAARLLRMPRQKRLGVVLRPCELRSLKELARLYGVSYPTVRNRLDGLIEKVGRLKAGDENQNEREAT